MTNYLHIKVLEAIQGIVKAAELNGEKITHEVRISSDRVFFKEINKRTIITIEISE